MVTLKQDNGSCLRAMTGYGIFQLSSNLSPQLGHIGHENFFRLYISSISQQNPHLGHLDFVFLKKNAGKSIATKMFDVNEISTTVPGLSLG